LHRTECKIFTKAVCSAHEQKEGRRIFAFERVALLFCFVEVPRADVQAGDRMAVLSSFFHDCTQFFMHVSVCYIKLGIIRSFLPQTLHIQAWDRTRACAVGDRRVTASVRARPGPATTDVGPYVS
jgi:hypothetical protein